MIVLKGKRKLCGQQNMARAMTAVWWKGMQFLKVAKGLNVPQRTLYLSTEKKTWSLNMPLSVPMGRKIFQDKSVTELRLDEGGEMLCSDSTGSVLSLQ
jgi:hypothetical protein